MEYTHIKHGFDAVFDRNSRVLILGTMPSPKSRENHFYYGHPQNRFWSVLSEVLEVKCPVSIDEKIDMLKNNHIALWDTIEECDIVGASDSSIRNAVPSDLSRIYNCADINMTFTNGSAAYRYYCRYQREKFGKDAICLPSTSPANARWTKQMLVEKYRIIKKYL